MTQIETTEASLMERSLDAPFLEDRIKQVKQTIRVINSSVQVKELRQKLLQEAEEFISELESLRVEL